MNQGARIFVDSLFIFVIGFTEREAEVFHNVVCNWGGKTCVKAIHV